MVPSMFLIALSVVLPCVLAINGADKHGAVPEFNHRMAYAVQAPQYLDPAATATADKEPIHPLKAMGNNCYGEETSEMKVQFCTVDKICEGKCAGGVYKGQMFCKLDSATCKDRFGVEQDEWKQVLVKFNHTRFGHRKDVSDEKLNLEEIERMRQLAGTAHVVQLYGLIDLPGGLELDGKKLIMPGMVMEYLSGESISAYFDEFLTGVIKVEQVAREFPCMMEQTAMAVEKMIAKGFIHADLNPGNMIRTGEQYTSAMTEVTCPLIKVIDFGVTDAVPANPMEQETAIYLFAFQIDRIVKSYIDQASPTDQLQLKQIIAPSPTTVNMFAKFFPSTYAEGQDVSKKEYSFGTGQSYWNTLQRLAILNKRH